MVDEKNGGAFVSPVGGDVGQLMTCPQEATRLGSGVADGN